MANRHRVENARRLMKILDRDPLHAEQVRFLALRLFDELKKIHGLDEAARDCLEASSLLHDIGYSQGLTRHHKRSAALIIERGVEGFDRREVRIIAYIARYHRKSGPKKSHADFSALSRDDRDRVERLSALLRIADGLDQGHDAAVKDLTATFDKSAVSLELVAGTEIKAGINGMLKKSDLFVAVFGREIKAVTRGSS
jgi:exopolyphosphatase/pppGpp-phosphohydrolase